MFSEVINFVSGLFILDPIIYVACSERYSRIREDRRISESNQGLSLGRIVTYLNGIQLLTKPRNKLVNLTQASFTDPSFRLAGEDQD